MTPEKASSFNQHLAWLTESRLVLTTLDVHPDKLAGGWDLVVDSARSHNVPLATLHTGGHTRSVATAQWHALLLVDGNGGEERASSSAAGQAGRSVIVVVSRITAQVVQRLPLPPSIGEPLMLCMDEDTSASVPGGDASGAAALHLAGSSGIAHIAAQRAALEVWSDFVSTGDYTAALSLIEERQEEETLAAMEEGADVSTGALVGAGGVGSLSGAAGPSEDRLEQAKARVFYAMMREACARGDYVAAADAAGAFGGSVAAAAGLPSFHELALAFHPRSDDDDATLSAKVRLPLRTCTI